MAEPINVDQYAIYSNEKPLAEECFRLAIALKVAMDRLRPPPESELSKDIYNAAGIDQYLRKAVSRAR